MLGIFLELILVETTPHLGSLNCCQLSFSRDISSFLFLFCFFGGRVGVQAAILKSGSMEYRV